MLQHVAPDTQVVPRQDEHHDLVRKAVKHVIKEGKHVGGQLGRPSSARFRTYERLLRYAGNIEGTLFDSELLRRAIDDIYRYPLRQSAVDTLNRQLRSGVSDQILAELVIGFREEDKLCHRHEDNEIQEPRIICSMGLVEPREI